MKNFLKENWFLIFAIIYVLSPIDLIPELFIPLLGNLDDTGVLLIELARRLKEK